MIDEILKGEDMDCKFTPYNVIAFSDADGVLEFVPNCCSVQEAQLSSNRDLHKYLMSLSNDEAEQRQIMKNWSMSCAGYAVATYILAIGDRHLENLMLTDKGCMFHIDFGFILGKNPKMRSALSFAVAPIRLDKAMMTAMGGVGSDQYNEWRSLTSKAFIKVRRHRNLLINLIYLMADAKIQDIPSEEVLDILDKMNSRFLPELTEEEARVKFEAVIDQSVNSVSENLMQMQHEIAIKMK